MKEAAVSTTQSYLRRDFGTELDTNDTHILKLGFRKSLEPLLDQYKRMISNPRRNPGLFPSHSFRSDLSIYIDILMASLSEALDTFACQVSQTSQ